MRDDTYHLRTETTCGETKYYAAFSDSSSHWQEIEIPGEVYMALDRCRLKEKGQQNVFDRYTEHLELSESQLAARTLRPLMPMEEAVAQAVDMQAALASLTDTQRRRFLLYHEHELNFEQIAKVEGCKHQVVMRSIATAKAKLKNFLDEGGAKQGSK